MKKITTITICVLVLLLSSTRLSKDIAKEPVKPVKVVEVVEEVVEVVEVPIEVVKVPIEIKTTSRKDINTLAQEKMNDLMATDCWDHTNSNGCDFICRTKSYRNDYSWIGENLYRGVCNKETAFRMWRESPSHLEVLNHEYNQEVLLIREYEENHCYMVLIRGIKK